MPCLHTPKSETEFQSCIKRAPQPENERAGGRAARGRGYRAGTATLSVLFFVCLFEWSQGPNAIYTYGGSAGVNKKPAAASAPNPPHDLLDLKARHLRVRGRYVLEKVELPAPRIKGQVQPLTKRRTCVANGDMNLQIGLNSVCLTHVTVAGYA